MTDDPMQQIVYKLSDTRDELTTARDALRRAYASVPMAPRFADRIMRALADTAGTLEQVERELEQAQALAGETGEGEA